MLLEWLERQIVRMPGFRDPKFKRFIKIFDGKEFNLLDVGCGNHSAARTKGVFKNCHYFGLDRDNYNNSAEDYALMEKFFNVNLESDNLSEVPDNFFHVIMVNHVLEHLHEGLPVVERLAKKLCNGGYIYIEFPSIRSMNLPNMPGTLNFCDDASHVRLYDVKDVANVLLDNNCHILRAGCRRDWFFWFITPMLYVYTRYVKRTSYAGTLWDFMGFADFVFAQRKLPS